MGPDQEPPIDRDDIQIIARNSNWKEEKVAGALKETVYNSAMAWKFFLRISLLALGVSFIVAGIIFFFAYNWAGLNKFAKIGIVLGLIITTIVLSIVPKLSLTMRNIFLAAASVLVGVLFAVYGQIYQTGANAYDFFLGWTVFISLWVLVSNFSPLWLIWLTLVNTTFVLYTEQVASGWSEILVLTVLFGFNAIILMATLLVPGYSKGLQIPVWFTNTLALATVTFSTIGICLGIFEKHEPSLLVLIVMTAIAYAAGFKYGLDSRRAYYLSIIPFSLIIIISALLIEISNNQWMLLLVSAFVIVSVTLLIMKLISFQKKWAHEAGK